jgi:DNA polymerase-3 subunit delta'
LQVYDYMILQWQKKAWESLSSRRQRLPHALLVTGKPGLGKAQLAKTFAQGLLCTAPDDTGHPCGNCESCNWFALGNHPDFRLIQPDSMAPESEEEAKKEKKKSDQIRIEQARDLEGFLAIGTHRGGLRIIVLHPADAMNAITQNAVLKSLEEPPASTLFMLVSSHPQGLLPTIRSRCQSVLIDAPDAAEAQSWLLEQGVADPVAALASAAGAPLAALNAAEWEEPHQAFLSKLQEQRFDPISLAEMCNALDPAMVVNWMQRWVYDLLRLRTAGTVRYHPNLQVHIQRISRGLKPAALSAHLRRLAHARALASHPLNPKLFFENLFLDYRAVVAA